MTKTVKVSYSFYKKYFRDCKTGEYDPKRKIIEIEVPERPKFPKIWKVDGIHRYTPDGIDVITYGSGYSESYVVVALQCLHSGSGVTHTREVTKTISPGVNARQSVMDTVADFSKLPNLVHGFAESVCNLKIHD